MAFKKITYEVSFSLGCIMLLCKKNKKVKKAYILFQTFCRDIQLSKKCTFRLLHFSWLSHDVSN